MWKMSFLTIILATVFLGGCNWGNNAVEDHPVRDVENDVRRGVDNVEDALDPNNRDDAYDRNVDGTNRGTVNENTTLPEATTPGSNADINSTNGYDNVPNANGVNGVERNDNVNNNNDIVDDKVKDTEKYRDGMNNR
ncbi:MULTISPECIES: hypothetical protein [Lysinibacillus]|jgi:hypothetical protein|uniref:Uncharacterized protein n=1 Tax=Lysinibacillus fusiformis TaxID=28031 RepID=A0A2I0V5U7_9BACI|nr:MULTISPECIES: hypothetical protein [Lysinibacillus]KUF35522.1 hypothetical protein AK833_07145 [Lysinibacillus sp. F5]MEE3807583.1 hypothetical protein [Lysinibacillus fusiformis]PKU53681.1 hypothetical protein CRI88_04995 [Lysinibacillus fusiformis]WCH48366.1 hypothetical protein NV349_02975 [Lysinibacillus sp. OF-1]SCY46873.1 hypothetical protein SAMN02787078_01537 [Lysinibacillus sp. SG9]